MHNRITSAGLRAVSELSYLTATNVVRYRADMFAPGEALANWDKLSVAFKTMHENAADFIASLHSIQAEEMMATDGFLMLKDNLVNYLQHFVKSLQRSTYRILVAAMVQKPCHSTSMFVMPIAALR